MENYICFKCQKLCPYGNTMVDHTYLRVTIVNLEFFSIISPCSTTDGIVVFTNRINKFIVIRKIDGYSANANFNLLSEAISYCLALPSSLEDTLKLTKIKLQIGA